jgi:hypothetical protein
MVIIIHPDQDAEKLGYRRHKVIFLDVLLTVGACLQAIINPSMPRRGEVYFLGGHAGAEFIEAGFGGDLVAFAGPFSQVDQAAALGAEGAPFIAFGVDGGLSALGAFDHFHGVSPGGGICRLRSVSCPTKAAMIKLKSLS